MHRRGVESLSAPSKPTRVPRAPQIVSAARRDGSLMSEINAYMADFAVDRFTTVYQEASDNKGRRGKATGGGSPRLGAKVGAGLGRGTQSEKNLMSALGFYWEPLLHDIAFFEGMRDSVTLLEGAYQKMTDLIMDGFEISSPDPEIKQWLSDNLVHSQQVDFAEVVRSSVYELLTISNAYKRPVYGAVANVGTVIKSFVPIRVTALRKYRDEDLITQGYIQLLHRPAEFLHGAPSIPTIYTGDEICCGVMHTHGWYAYGVPSLAAMPFVIKMKLQMERDIAEMLHQHVPRIDITYSPDEQMNQEQVDKAIADVKTQVASLAPTDNLVHTPDTIIEYKGPLGKAMDFSGPQNHVEAQHFYSLPISPDVLGANQNVNAYTAQQRWHMTAVTAGALRQRVFTMLKPALDYISEANGWAKASWPTFNWATIDSATDYQQSQTSEIQIANAATKRDQGFIDQDTAAKDATRSHKGGPVRKAAAPGALPVPISPTSAAPSKTEPTTSGKVKNKDKGPSGKIGPKTDPRPKGKRHETFADISDAALAHLSDTTEGSPLDGDDEETTETIA